MRFQDHSNAVVQKQFVAAVFSGDHDTIRCLAHPDFALHEGSGMPFAGIYRSADGFIAFLEIFTNAFEIRKLEEVRAFMAGDPDHMAFLFELEAILRSAGTPFVSTLAESWVFKGGKVLEIRAHYFNSPFHP